MWAKGWYGQSQTLVCEINWMDRSFLKLDHNVNDVSGIPKMSRHSGIRLANKSDIYKTSLTKYLTQKSPDECSVLSTKVLQTQIITWRGDQSAKAIEKYMLYELSEMTQND